MQFYEKDGSLDVFMGLSSSVGRRQRVSELLRWGWGVSVRCLARC